MHLGVAACLLTILWDPGEFEEPAASRQDKKEPAEVRRGRETSVRLDDIVPRMRVPRTVLYPRPFIFVSGSFST